MNILFVLQYYRIGGVQTVTHVLANKFVKEGHNSSIFSFNRKQAEVSPPLDKKVRIHFNDVEENKAITDKLKNILVNDSIDLIINQSGHIFPPVTFIKRANQSLNIPIVSVYHNSPGTTYSLDIKNPIKKMYYILKDRFSMRYVYNQSDYFILLSPTFISSFKKFIRVRNANKLFVIPNPITVPFSEYRKNPKSKLKEIIYVGRIDHNQKRVSRVIETWNLLERDFPDWRLTIVGDGISLPAIKKQVKNLSLHNVNFEGFKKPYKYYKRASLLILTSEYEGFGLVIAEAMSFGVIPAVYGSYSSVYDIISNGIDGIIIPYDTSGFKVNRMADEFKKLMSDKNKRELLSTNAIQNIEKYSIDIIYNQWIGLLQSLNK